MRVFWGRIEGLAALMDGWEYAGEQDAGRVCMGSYLAIGWLHRCAWMSETLGHGQSHVPF